MKSKVGRYDFRAESFHCDFAGRLFMGYLGNDMLNAADFHSSERGFGMDYLNPIHKTWVLSRLAIEMRAMPRRNARYSVETWVEGVMRTFTNRNFRVTDADDDSVVYGYGRSIWALIDTTTRQPVNIMDVRAGEIEKYIETEKPCEMEKLSRVKIDADAPLAASMATSYSDIDVNGHVNSVKYIEHVLNLFDLEFLEKHRVGRFDIAYVAESYYGDELGFYREKVAEDDYQVRVTRTSPNGEKETEVCRCRMKFVKDNL